MMTMSSTMGLELDLDEGLEIDLDDVAECMQKREALKKVCRDDCAKCSRMVIWGFASVRARLVDMFLKFLPLLHELVLPDLEEDPQVLALLSSMAEQRSRSNPRLRDVIFMDGTCVSLWLLPGSAQPGDLSDLGKQNDTVH